MRPQKNLHGERTDKQTNTRTSQLLDQNGPVGRFGEKDVLYSVYNIQHTEKYTVSVLGREEGYMVKYTPPPEGVPRAKPEGTLEG